MARARPASSSAGVKLDICAPAREELEAVALTPGEELSQVQSVGVPGQASVASEEAGQGEAFGAGEDKVGDGGESW